MPKVSTDGVATPFVMSPLMPALSRPSEALPSSVTGPARNPPAVVSRIAPRFSLLPVPMIEIGFVRLVPAKKNCAPSFTLTGTEGGMFKPWLMSLLPVTPSAVSSIVPVKPVETPCR